MTTIDSILLSVNKLLNLLLNTGLFKQYIEEVRNDHGVPGAIRYYECANVDGYYMCWHDDSTVDCKVTHPSYATMVTYMCGYIRI